MPEEESLSAPAAERSGAMKGASREGRGPGARPPGTDVFTVRILYRDKETPGRFMGVVEEAAPNPGEAR